VSLLCRTELFAHQLGSGNIAMLHVVKQSIVFKVASLIHQVLSGHGPSYLAAVLLPLTTPEDSIRLSLICFSLLGRRPTLVTALT